MPIETLTYTYTTQAEIERIWSAAAGLLRADDDQDGVAESGVWDDVVNEATDTVNLYLERWYDAEDMANNLWVRRAATWIGAHLLSLRRGDSGNYFDRYERILAALQEIWEGKRQVPRLAQRADTTPAMSNLRVDQRFAIQKIRVQQSTSTGGTSSRQDLDPQYPWGEWYP
jgi:hypothetical protein